MSILVTGGAGYIGSHTSVELLKAGYEVVIVDNFSNSKPESLTRINELTGKDFKFYQLDIRNEIELEKVFAENEIHAVIHFAGLKAVGESVIVPLRYYDNNLNGTNTLCKVMEKFQVKKLVFSSSATVYGSPDKMPITEDFPLYSTNPYGKTKLMIEEVLRDLYSSDHDWSIAILRYFNPIGAHESGRMGEDPNGVPNNLMPYITQVASGRLKELHVYGSDYPTKDGTGVRDYIHVVDLAKGHIKALYKVLHDTGVDAYNLGTGRGYSVLELVKVFEETTGVIIPFRLTERRSGDIAVCYADPSKARDELGWTYKKDITEMIRDSWRWQSQNPNGYEEEITIPL